MKKRDKIIYWIATIWLSLGMGSTGFVQLIRMDEEVALIVQGLRYPLYILALLGVWKLLGVVAVLIPKYPVLKEWAYAGFFFTMTGAIYSHLAAGSTMGEIFPPILLLILTVVSYYFRPADRKIISVNHTNVS